jgi:nucleotide-binding universal stress UspA family protein
MRYRAHVGFILANAAFAAIFVALVLGAFHAPAPHNVPVGIVAPASVTGQVEDALDRGSQNAFDLQAYPSESGARTAISRHDIDGALVVSGRNLRLLIAQAGGTGPAQALTRTFTALAARTGQPLTVTDVVAPLPGDTEALSPFFVILGVLIPSVAAGSTSALAFRRARPAWCVAAPAAVAVAIGVIAAGIADGVAGLGNYAVIAGIVALFSLAISAPTAALGRIWPPLGAVAVLIFIVLGIPASGGPGNLGSFGPAFLRILHPALPLGAAADAMRGAVYFHGYGTATPVSVLAYWAAAGIIGLTLVVAWRRRVPVRLLTPATSAHLFAPVPVAALANGQVPAGAFAAAGSRPASGPASSLGPDRTSSSAGEPAVAAPQQPTPGSIAPASIVVGFDNSVPAQRALGWTARLAATRPVTLHLVYADHAEIDSDLSGFAYAEMAAARNEEAAAVEQAAADIIARAGVPYTFERREGTPAEAILAGASARAAATPGADGPVIVVGRSGRAAHHVLGSVPVRLLHRSPYPVLAIP